MGEGDAVEQVGGGGHQVVGLADGVGPLEERFQHVPELVVVDDGQMVEGSPLIEGVDEQVEGERTRCQHFDGRSKEAFVVALVGGVHRSTVSGRSAMPPLSRRVPERWR